MGQDGIDQSVPRRFINEYPHHDSIPYMALSGTRGDGGPPPAPEVSVKINTPVPTFTGPHAGPSRGLKFNSTELEP